MDLGFWRCCNSGFFGSSPPSQAIESGDFEVVFTISGTLPSGTQQAASGSEFPEKWRDSAEIFDGNTLYDGMGDFVRYRQNRVKDGNPRWRYLEFYIMVYKFINVHIRGIILNMANLCSVMKYFHLFADWRLFVKPIAGSWVLHTDINHTNLINRRVFWRWVKLPMKLPYFME